MSTLYPFKDKLDFIPLVTNGLSHTYQMDESTFILRGSGREFFFYFNFIFDEYHVSKQNSPNSPIWGQSVSLCSIKRTPGLYGLKAKLGTFGL